MRADRLVAIVLLLQVHGQRTASQLAESLETSQRTIRRDLDALSGAGVPVYAQRGRGGGWALLGGHRIDLSGLTAGEARALVLAATGAPDQAGVDGALRKVLAALPAPVRDQVSAAQASVHVDRESWGHRADPEGGEKGGRNTSFVLEQLRQALDRGVQVDLCYARPGATPSWRRVHPHGLVVKRGIWYLVAAAESGLRTYRVSRVEATELSPEAAVVPNGFDLQATWESLQRDFSTLRPPVEIAVDLLVDPQVWPRLSGGLGGWWPGTQPKLRRQRTSICCPPVDQCTACAGPAQRMTMIADAPRSWPTFSTPSRHRVSTRGFDVHRHALPTGCSRGACRARATHVPRRSGGLRRGCAPWSW